MRGMEAKSWGCWPTPRPPDLEDDEGLKHLQVWGVGVGWLQSSRDPPVQGRALGSVLDQVPTFSPSALHVQTSSPDPPLSPSPFKVDGVAS